MIKFSKPKNLNGAELLDEIRSAGISINDVPMVDGNADLWLDIDRADENIVSEIVKKHNGNVIPKELTVKEKLEFVGLSIEELKRALI